jgi:hypothetical protein
MYKILKNILDNKEYGAVRDNGDGTHTSFVFDTNSTDYQQYLKWLAEGNTPEPAEEQQ